MVIFVIKPVKKCGISLKNMEFCVKKKSVRNHQIRINLGEIMIHVDVFHGLHEGIS